MRFSRAPKRFADFGGALLPGVGLHSPAGADHKWLRRQGIICIEPATLAAHFAEPLVLAIDHYAECRPCGAGVFSNARSAGWRPLPLNQAIRDIEYLNRYMLLLSRSEKVI
jgi:hypothetical protein